MPLCAFGTRGEAGRVRARLPCLGVFLFVHGGAWAAGPLWVPGGGYSHLALFSPLNVRDASPSLQHTCSALVGMTDRRHAPGGASVTRALLLIAFITLSRAGNSPKHVRSTDSLLLPPITNSSNASATSTTTASASASATATASAFGRFPSGASATATASRTATASATASLSATTSASSSATTSSSSSASASASATPSASGGGGGDSNTAGSAVPAEIGAAAGGTIVGVLIGLGVATWLFRRRLSLAARRLRATALSAGGSSGGGDRPPSEYTQLRDVAGGGPAQAADWGSGGRGRGVE
jgi:hypothetical protein